MWQSVRRLLLGFGLILAASAALLLSDTTRRRGSDVRLANQLKVAILQHASQPIIDEGVRGMIAGLAEGGFVEGRNLTIARYNSENDVATANAIAAEITSGDADLVLTATTVSMQAVANANLKRHKRHVFALVTDPFGSGVGISRDDPLDHPPYMVGYGTMQPVERALEIALSMRPGLAKIGIPFNPGETNSQIATDLAKKACAAKGIEVIDASVENTAAVGEGVASLVARGAEAIWSPGDVTVLTAADIAVAQARKGGVPFFTNIPGTTDQGSLFDVGANYLEVGRLAGRLAARVLSGADPATIPVENVVPERVTVNPEALEGLRDEWTVPPEILAEAARTAAAATATADVTPPAPTAAQIRQRFGRKAKIDLLEYVQVEDSEDAERGIRDGFREAGLVDGSDFELEVRIAQGDMPTLPALVDAALTEGTDLIMTLSTPTLQAALSRAKGKPIVYTFCASGIAAGAGRTNEDHLPNVTGVPSASPYDDMIALAREMLPGIRRIGTLVVPAEANSVFNTTELIRVANSQGIDVVQVSVNAVTEVPDAAVSLVSRDLDAVVQVASNLTTSSFVTISRAADSAHVPLLSSLSGDLDHGAAVVIARDFYEAGKQASGLALRVLAGEDPAGIPFQPLEVTRLMVNLDAARAQGFEIPEAVVSRAAKVIGKR